VRALVEYGALRERLGDQRFRAGLRAFVASQRAGRGTAADFTAAMPTR
jgi:aminopeptidase N